MYTVFRNKVTAILRRAKHLYRVKLFFQAGNLSENIWSIIDSTLKYLKVNGTISTGLFIINYVDCIPLPLIQLLVSLPRLALLLAPHMPTVSL